MSRLHALQRRYESSIGRLMLFLLARSVYRLPLPAALALGRNLGWLAPRLSPRHFRRVAADITAAFADAYTPEEIDHLTSRVYVRLGESLIEFLRLPYLSREKVRHWARLEGTEHIDAALAKGKGVILLTAHVGNWEICGTVMGLSGYPTTAVARTQEDPAITALLTKIRETHGLRVIPMTDVRSCLRALQRNECLGIVGDVNARKPGAFVQFFGRPAATYTGAAYLAQSTGAEIVPIFDERLPDHSHVCRLHPAIPVADTGDAKRDLLITTMRCQYVIQQEIRRRPQDWYWLIQRWKTKPEEITNPERIPMEHRDLTPDEAAAACAWLTEAAR